MLNYLRSETILNLALASLALWVGIFMSYQSSMTKNVDKLRVDTSIYSAIRYQYGDLVPKRKVFLVGVTTLGSFVLCFSFFLL